VTVAFLLTALVVCVSPGIGVVYTLSMSLRGGVRAGLLASLGCTLCTILHLGFALAGLAAILHTTAVLFQAIKFAGVAYLLWMAWATLRHGGSLDLRSRAETGSAGRIVWRGVLINLLNPKLPLFFVAFLPARTRRDAPALRRLVRSPRCTPRVRKGLSPTLARRRGVKRSFVDHAFHHDRRGKLLHAGQPSQAARRGGSDSSPCRR